MKVKNNRKVRIFLFWLAVIILIGSISYMSYFFMGNPLNIPWLYRSAPQDDMNSNKNNVEYTAKNVVFKYYYEKCRHIYFYDLSRPPAEFADFRWVDFSEQSSEIPEGWEVSKFNGKEIILEYHGDLCPVCMEKQYLGIYEGKLAVFFGDPPGGTLKEILPFNAKEVYKQELEMGIPFNNDSELERLLENFTS